MNTRHPRRRRTAKLFALCLGAVALAGCERNDMMDQPRHEPMEESKFFADDMSSRPMVPGTIARGQLVANNMRFSGLPEGPTPEVFPFEITKSDLERGRQRFEIYCSVCHGATGDADGMIVRRGFVRPPSYHEQRLKDAPVGHFYDVITNGFGAMYSYNDRIFPEDRWRIAAYIRVLQLAQEKAVASVGGIAPTNVTPSGNQNPIPATSGEKPAGSHQ
jgi:mono/diheme cytochrome c family protein